MGKHVSKKKSAISSKIRDSVRESVNLISEYDENKKITVTDYIKIATAAVLLIIINLFKVQGIVELLAYLIPFFLISYDMFLTAIKKSYKRTFPEDEALIIGCSVMCFAIGSYTEAVVIVIIYKVMLILEDIINKKQMATDDLVAIGSLKQGHVLTVYGPENRDIKNIRCGDLIQVENDGIIPLDGVVDAGRGAFDYSIFTGEDTLINLKPGDNVTEGCINVSGAPVSIRVTSEYYESTGYVLNGMIRSASSDCSYTEKLIYKIIWIFRLVCIPLALIIAIIPGIITDMWFDWISRAVIILFVSQSQILKKLILFVFDSGIVTSALNGIFIRSNRIIERLSDTSCFVFEKAGVITEGDYEIRKVVPVGISESELLAYAAKVESQSDHPLAVALRNNVDGSVLKRYSLDRFTEYPGKGVSAYINGSKVYAGKFTFVSGFCEPHSYSDSAGAAIHLSINGKYAGFISFTDRIKEGAFDALEKLRADRSAKLVMLTGDSAVSSRKMAAALNFDMIKSEVSPEDKKNSLNYLIKNKNKSTWVTYIGNSRTDQTILESADVAVTYSSLYEHPVVKEASDVHIFGRGIDKVAQTVTLSESVIKKVKISALVFGAIKALIIIFGLTGLLPVLPAVIIDAVTKILLTIYTLLFKL